MATVSFRITGRGLTTRLRDIVLSGTWPHAFEMAEDAIGHAVGLADICAILGGDKCLVDADGGGMSLADEDTDERIAYRAELLSVYGGGFQDREGRYWRAYALIDNYGTHDSFLGHTIDTVHLRSGSDEHPELWVRPTKDSFAKGEPRMGVATTRRCDNNPVLRALWYAKSRERDRAHRVVVNPALDEQLGIERRLPSHMTAQMLSGHRLVALWEEAPSPPPFVGRWARTPQEAFDQALEIGAWPEIRGHDQMYGAMSEPERGFALETVLRKRDQLRESEKLDRDSVAGRIFQGLIGPGEDARDELMETIREQEEAAAQVDVKAARAIILAKAADIGGFLEVATPPAVAAWWPHLGPVLKIPKAPLENWALWRTNVAGLAPTWVPVTPTGWKGLMDDPYHTDWLIGAGFTDPKAMETSKFAHGNEKSLASAQALSDLADRLKTEIQDRALGPGATLLSGAGVVRGKVEHPKPDEKVTTGAIAVIPHAGPEYLEAALSAAAVITERGGSMAHLANIGRERNILIVRVDNARKRFYPGVEVTVDANDRKVELERGPWRDISCQFLPRDDGWTGPKNTASPEDEDLPSP